MSVCTDAIIDEIYWQDYKIEETKSLGPTLALFLHINCVIFKWAHRYMRILMNYEQLYFWKRGGNITWQTDRTFRLSNVHEWDVQSLKWKSLNVRDQQPQRSN
jgi:hypothetical protein